MSLVLVGLCLLAALPLRAKEMQPLADITVPADAIQAENAHWEALGVKVPDGGIVLEHPFATPYSGRSLIVPRTWIARFLQEKGEHTVNAAALRADLPLMETVLRKNYAGWETAAHHGWDWDAWFKRWDAMLAAQGDAVLPLQQAFAPWQELQRFQLDGHSGLLIRAGLNPSRTALLASTPSAPCTEMTMASGETFKLAPGDAAQQPHSVLVWQDGKLSNGTTIVYPTLRGAVQSVRCGASTISATPIWEGHANAKSDAFEPVRASFMGEGKDAPAYRTLAPGVDYLRLPNFGEGTDEALRKLVASLPESAGRGGVLIFDLRGNGGGDAPLDVLGRWLPESAIAPAEEFDRVSKRSCLYPGLWFGLVRMVTWRVQPPVSPGLKQHIEDVFDLIQAPASPDCPVSLERSKASWHDSDHVFKPDRPFAGTRIIALVDSGCASDCEYLTHLIAAVPGSVIVGANTFGLAGFTQPGFFVLPHSGVPFRIATSVTDPYGDGRSVDGYGLDVDVVLPTREAGMKASVLALASQLAAPRAAETADPSTDCRMVDSEHFAFHDDPWINLHHFLFQWARNVPTMQPGDHRRAVEVPEAAEFSGLSKDERATWRRAVDYYRTHLIDGHLLFDRDLIGLRSTLGGLACGKTSLNALDPDLRTALTAAMPVYRAHWWPAHHAANEAWIEERMGQLKTSESKLGERLAAAYGGEWAPERVRVDVSAYSNWAGAYTTNDPNQITLSSRDYMGLDGLEILFHEVSHVSFFEQPLFKQLADAFNAYGTKPPDRLAHSIQFATPAELLRTLLGDQLPPDHRFVGELVSERGSQRQQYAIVVKHWKPFLNGLISREQALDGIAAEIVGQEPSRK